MKGGALHIGVVEDDPWFAARIQHHLAQNPDYKVTLLKSAAECLASLHLGFDVLTIDYSLPDQTGLALVRSIRSNYAHLPLIALSAQSNVHVAVDFLKSGANDYVVKDDDAMTMLWNAILRIREQIVLREEVQDLRMKLEQKSASEHLVQGSSNVVKALHRIIERAAGTAINVLIQGETGTGKELVARSIHQLSERRKKPFVAVNVAALPDELIESELFGYEKGAFTGALARKKGKLEEAHGGTLFLDEIGEMQPLMQSKLLRALQEREIVRLGGNEAVKIDVRLISATHRNLAEAVQEGRFREDLYYRIIGLPISLKPLRERREDIPLLAKEFLAQFCKRNNIPQPTISAQAMKFLIAQNYYGNIRELKSIMELAAVMCDGAQILPEHCVHPGSIVSASPKGSSLKEITRSIIQEVLDQHRGNVLRTAEQLEIGKSRLYEMIATGELKIPQRA